MRTVVVYKWARDPGAATVRGDGSVEWRNQKPAAVQVADAAVAGDGTDQARTAAVLAAAVRAQGADTVVIGDAEDHAGVREDGSAVPGLYSTGCDAGGLFGGSYLRTVPSSANGFALTSGWLAADDATAAIKGTARLRSRSVSTA